MRLLRALLLPCLPAALAAQAAPRMPDLPAMPRAGGFRVFVLTDMEGLASVVFNREIISGYEGERYRNASSQDYWQFYRGILTREVNAAIAGARQGGARSFVVNEGHGGNLFGSILPWDLDTAALLVRGWPKPMVMSTGLDSSAGAAIFLGMHAGAGTPGVIAHTYAFDRITVNGRPFTLPKPYTVEFTLRASYPQDYVTATDSLSGYRLEKTAERSYRFVTNDAREMARLFDAIELIVLR